MRQKVVDLLPIQEAMDNLGAVSSIHLDGPGSLGVIEGRRIITDPEELSAEQIEWIDAEGTDKIYEIMDLTYRSVHRHLKELVERSRIDFKSKKNREGIASMMVLVGESAKILNKYLKYRLGETFEDKIETRKSYQALQEYYTKRLASEIEGKKSWKEELAKSDESLPEKLKDFGSVLRDQSYELFYINQEDGTPFITERQIQNLKLTSDFDLALGEFEEDPFLKVRAIDDRDLQGSALQILKECEKEIGKFYKMTKKLFQYNLAKDLSQAILALFLAANPASLLQRTALKHSSLYFADFQMFLRKALQSSEYQKWIAYPPPESDKPARHLMYLIEKICFAFFTKLGGAKQESIGLIHRTARRGHEMKKHLAKEVDETLYSRLLLDDEGIRSLFSKYPNGPIYKTLDHIRISKDLGLDMPFDPAFQGNPPKKLLSFKKGKKSISLLHLPSPTRQFVIDKVEVLDEFRGFLRFMGLQNMGGLLLVNFQDRNDRLEKARSRILENIEDGKAFKQLFVMTLPKNTAFYNQEGPFKDLSSSKDFKDALNREIFEGDSYFFPNLWEKGSVKKAVEESIEFVHSQVFKSAKKLTLIQRQDFIELFYQILSLKAVESLKVDYLSFTCKDALDTGALTTGLFYALIQLSDGKLDGREKLDELRHLFYWPSMKVRERAPDYDQFMRVFSALETFSKAKVKSLKLSVED